MRKIEYKCLEKELSKFSFVINNNTENSQENFELEELKAIILEYLFGNIQEEGIDQFICNYIKSLI